MELNSWKTSVIWHIIRDHWVLEHVVSELSGIWGIEPYVVESASARVRSFVDCQKFFKPASPLKRVVICEQFLVL